MKILGYVTLVIALFALFSLAYNIKVKLGINLGIGKKHTPCYLQDYSFGLIKCEWFANPHHCNCNKE